MISIKKIRKDQLAKCICILMAFLFFQNSIGDNIFSIESEIEIELSEKEFEDKSEKEKELEKEVEKDHFYTCYKNDFNTFSNQNHFICPWLSANSAFGEIISPPPDRVLS